MKKTAITIHVPAIGQQHDFLIPSTMLIRDVLSLIVKILVSEYGVIDDDSDLMLFDEEDGKALGLGHSLSQLGLTDGARLVML